MDAMRRFDASYREHVTLADGRKVELRPIRPEDKELLARGFARQSAESRFRRFFTEKDSLSNWELKYLTEVDGDNHFALGAVETLPDGTVEGRGIARFVKLKDRPDVAEAAIAVDDAAHGLGLGRLLFQRMCAAAREHGVERLRCEVLAFNEPMRKILKDIAPDAQIESSGSVLTMEFPVPDDALDFAETRKNPLYRLLVLAAEGLIAVRRAFDLLLGDDEEEDVK
jgi:GNAT superfamily N-acetyltransferase